MFDPTNVDDMARVIGRALDDEALRASFRDHAVRQAATFSWDKTARTALAAMEAVVAGHSRDRDPALPAQDSRPGLAVVAGSRALTATDGAALVGMLGRHYDVTIVALDAGSDENASEAAPNRRDAEWLRENAGRLDRILYAAGDDSAFEPMSRLLREVPGILAIDDLFLGPVLERLETSGSMPGAWTRALYETHGYPAVRDRFRDPAMAARTYSACLEILRAATGVVVGSESARDRAAHWLGTETTRAWAVAPSPAGGPTEACADAWADVIETLAARARPSIRDLAEAIAAVEPAPAPTEVMRLSAAIARSMPPGRVQRQLLLDVSHTAHTDLHTGIQRVTRALVAALLGAPPDGYRIEPVYLAEAGGIWHYRYARRFALKLLDCPQDAIEEDIVEPSAGDVLFVLDLSGLHMIQAAASGLYANLRNRGLTTYGTVYDLLPVTLPHLFPAGSEKGHDDWLRVIAGMDGAICISRAVADELGAWVERKVPDRKDDFRIGWFHLGADIENSVPTRGLPDGSAAVLDAMAARPTFLMVSTVEPRKGYLQALGAFDRLWAEGVDVNLIVVGTQGWTQLPEHLRNTIPEIVARLRDSPERDRRLFWLAGISDEYLERVYAGATCLISASEGEGFGLPLIEAARHGVPILARDIPVFREVAGDHVTYFRGLDPADLASAVTAWTDLYRQGRHARSDGMPRTTWKEAAARLVQFVRDGDS